MILSNIEIHRALDDRRLVIDPEPHPRSPAKDKNSNCPYQTSSVDLKLGDEISYFKSDLALNINLTRGGFAKLFGPNSEQRKITAEQPYLLKPNHFVLGKTLEIVSLPIVSEGTCLAARIEGKSSYARCGLLIHFTAPTIHSGFSGTITLELINLGPCDIALVPGAAICQLIIEEVRGVPFKNDSQFQGQLKAGGVLS